MKPIDIEVIRVRRLWTLADPRIRSLIMRAASKAMPWANPDAVYKELLVHVTADSLGVFVGFAKREPRALAVASLPTTTFMIAPMVAVIYSESEPALIRKVGVKLGAWIVASGYTSALGVNLRHSDAALCRGLRGIGRTEVVASLVRCEFNERGNLGTGRPEPQQQPRSTL